MELASKGSLKEYIQNSGPLSENMCADVGEKILKGLCYLHGQNIIHRDLKCANILLTEHLYPKISDFGTAKVVYTEDNDDIARLSASLKGTPFYMAPEVIRRTGHNQSADVWSFGCMMIEMVSGKAPWTVTGAKFSEIVRYIS
jgi:serine/threonine protein kinase